LQKARYGQRPGLDWEWSEADYTSQRLLRIERAIV
jgi:hypothetical protein